MEKESLSVQIIAMELAVTVLKDKICELKAQRARVKEEEEETEEKQTTKKLDKWVEITGGVEHTIGRKAKVQRETKLYYWLLDGEVTYKRLKKNTKKFMYYDDSDDDTVVYE